jgi:hypothetical protein
MEQRNMLNNTTEMQPRCKKLYRTNWMVSEIINYKEKREEKRTYRIKGVNIQEIHNIKICMCIYLSVNMQIYLNPDPNKN